MSTSLGAPPETATEAGTRSRQQLDQIIMTTRDLPAMPQVASKVL